MSPYLGIRIFAKFIFFTDGTQSPIFVPWRPTWSTLLLLQITCSKYQPFLNHIQLGRLWNSPHHYLSIFSDAVGAFPDERDFPIAA